jgi:hypothetical protein
VHYLMHGRPAPVRAAALRAADCAGRSPHPLAQADGPLSVKGGFQDGTWRGVFDSLQRGNLERAQAALEQSLSQPAR